MPNGQELVADLQNRLAYIDPANPNPEIEYRVRVAQLKGRLQAIKVKMYQEKGHVMPHVHIDYGRQHHVAAYKINDGLRLSGNLHASYDKAVTRWILQRKTVLMELWETLRKGGDYEAIIGQIDGSA